ncbi:MAG TPA: proton-conducting transporter membrane subunit, partial [Aestuariivirgaceae bacterium]|nr:proton-conducting transporter membrane subunit [Aestuariivirgaceae bacterium]
MTVELALWLFLALPVAATVLIGLASRHPNLRETITLTAGVALLANVVWLSSAVLGGETGDLVIATILPEIDLAFRVEPLGILFGLVASGLWIVTSIFSIGYMRGNAERHQTRFYMCFPIAIMAALGIAYSANLVTLFVFYELLTFSTYPLVAHKETEEARNGARTYLAILVFTSITFLLTAIVWTWVAVGHTDFRPGGILAGNIDPTFVPLLLGLFMFGIGKAALMPFHRWLPSAMVAPTPVSALLHAVAVVKAGVFTVLKVTVYIFGIDFLASTGASTWLTYVAAFTLVMASVVALTKDNLKARLAYSTVSQLAYVVLAASLATTAGIIGGGVQIAMHAMGKITLFFCAGAIYVAAHKTEVSELDGLGRKMPWTFAAFLVGSLSIVGLPPFGGAWVKYWLITGALDAGEIAVVVVLIVSSLLS